MHNVSYLWLMNIANVLQVGTILGMLGHQLDQKMLDEIIAEVDADGSGQIEFEEFATLAARFLVEEDAEAMQAELKEAFRLYDKEGNGYITTGVLREILRELDDKITEEDLDMMIEEIDSDGSGTVDFDVLKNAFDAFDTEKNGYIQTDMIGMILEMLGQTLDDKSLAAVIREHDQRQTGKLDFEKFAQLASKYVEVEEDMEIVQRELKEAFRLYDKEGKGYLTLEVLRDILRELDDKITEDDLDMMIDEIDADGSGTVDFDGTYHIFQYFEQFSSLIYQLFFVCHSFRIHGSHDRLIIFSENTISFFCALAGDYVDVEEDQDAIREELREAFRMYDKYGVGYLTTDVLRDILHELDDKITEEDLDMMIDEIDADGSGTVDFEEFMEVMTGGHKAD
uniref:EF-hand domain-containing protein n=1 Tax=Phlebotomus papatasi TaxID=29031 RepID=A0A1B0DQ63_PHLPP